MVRAVVEDPSLEQRETDFCGIFLFTKRARETAKMRLAGPLFLCFPQLAPRTCRQLAISRGCQLLLVAGSFVVIRWLALECSADWWTLCWLVDTRLWNPVP